MRKGDFDAYILGWSGLSNDPEYLRTFFHTQEAGSGGKNYTRYRSQDFDRVADLASGELNTQTRRKLIYGMQALIAQEAPCIPSSESKPSEPTALKDGSKCPVAWEISGIS